MGYKWPSKKAPRYQTKFGRTDCNGGCSDGRRRWHHSREEAAYCNRLMLEHKAGRIKTYAAQIRYDIWDRFMKPCGYLIVDFVVINNDGRSAVHEYKGRGFETLMEFRHKRALFTWCYPNIPYHTVGKNQIVI